MTTPVLEKQSGIAPPVTKQLYSLTLANGAQSDVIDSTGASSVFIVSNKVLTIKVPTIDSNGDYTTTEAAIVDSDLHKNPTAAKAGFIAGNVMPPAFTLDNGSGAEATVYIYIVWRD
jgi:hypothetical protein|tara:strand:+ start:120 stop:470 length:351 start_codon:yes stop_codon:yes gene_type:complete